MKPTDHDLAYKEFEHKEDALLTQIIVYIISKLRKKDVDDYGIEINSFWVMLWDSMLSMSDMKRIIKYEIPESIRWEYWDMISLSCDSTRVKKTIKEWSKKWDDFSKVNLCTFYRVLNYK